MTKDFPGEKWKTIVFDFEYTNEGRTEVSNFGRLRTFNKVSDGNIVKGSMINGYRIIRLKLYRPRDEKMQKKFDYLQKQVYKLASVLKEQTANNDSKKIIKETTELLAGLKKNLSDKYKADLKARTINYHSLIHRLVAEYFLKKPSTKQTVVGHIDHEKLNNKVTNLKWMTLEENYKHQQSSPLVIQVKKDKKYVRTENSKTTKLTVTKVMLLKKMLNQGKPMKLLIKQFKISETQIYRIKNGENWGDIQAAH